MGFNNASVSDFKADDIRGVPPAELRQVFISGETGTGKTYLAHAIANGWKMTASYVKTQEAGTRDQEVMARANLLILDDLGSEADWDSYRAKILNVLSIREENGNPTIVTSNLTLDEIAQRDDRIASRLSGFLVLRCVGPDRRLGKKGVIPVEPESSGIMPWHEYANHWEVKWWLAMGVGERKAMFVEHGPHHRWRFPDRLFKCPKGPESLYGCMHVIYDIAHSYDKSLKAGV